MTPGMYKAPGMAQGPESNETQARIQAYLLHCLVMGR